MKISLVASLSLAAGALVSASPLVPRSQPTCKHLKANSNNGGRKIGIVIDSSGSMYSTDPYDLRILAGEQINDWLITSKGAGGSKKEDLVTVVDFDNAPTLLYPLGDPSGANNVFKLIDSMGSTYIAGGVDMARSELTKSGNDPTANRTGIVVLTDGSDYSTSDLVTSIDACGQLGIRVSFGFLTYDASYQDPEVLTAILGTGGMYATIDGATAQNSFVNLMIVHGLTDNDNPSNNASTTLVNGLSIASALGSSGESTLTYTAEANEKLTLTITSVSAGELNATANDANGKLLGEATASAYGDAEPLVVTAASAGDLKVKIQGEKDFAGSLFIVGVNSSIPIQNCTLSSGSSTGLSKGAKAGIGVAVPLIVGLFGLGSYFLWKYWKGIPGLGGSGAAPLSYPPNQPPMADPSYKQPMVQTDSLPAPSPNPTNVHPGWSVPPMPPPVNPGHPNAPQNDNNPQQNFNQQDPNHKSLNNPPNSDPYHPNQADPSHPNQLDPSHPNQLDPSHPNQLDPSHPNQLDPSHPHPPQADPSHHNNLDPSQHPPQTDPSQHPPQTDPSNQPSQNSPHQPPKFRFRLFPRRRKDDDKQQPQPVQPHSTITGNATYVGPAQPPQAYGQPQYAQPQDFQQQPPARQGSYGQQQQLPGVPIPHPYSPVGSPPPPQQQPYSRVGSPAPQIPPQAPYSPIASPQPQYPVPASSPPPQQQQYAAPVEAPAQALRQQQEQGYNVSPVLAQAELASPVSAVSPLHRRPVGGEGQQQS